MDYMGTTFDHNIHMDESPVPSMPDERAKQAMINNVFSDRDHMKTSTQLERIKTTLEQLSRHQGETERLWHEFYIHLRNGEMCTELVEDIHDEKPKGKKLWIELEYCEIPRRPFVLQLPNGACAVPIFTTEQEMEYYFMRQDVWESVTVPHPRVGSQLDVYNAMPQPVCGIGGIKRLASLATVATQRNQLPLIINPNTAATKIITYPEMLASAKSKKFEHGGSDIIPDEFKVTFDTTKTTFKRLHPSQVPHMSSTSGLPVPMIAKVELQLLMLPHSEIEAVHIVTKDASMWKRATTKVDKTTVVTIIPRDGGAGEVDPEAVFASLRKWSFVTEFSSDLEVVVAKAAPEGAQLLYTGAESQFYRETLCRKRRVVGREIDYMADLEW